MKFLKKIGMVILYILIMLVIITIAIYIGGIIGGKLATLIMGSELDFVVNGGKNIGRIIGGICGLRIVLTSFFPEFCSKFSTLYSKYTGFESIEDVLDWSDSMKASGGDKEALQRMIVRRMRKK